MPVSGARVPWVVLPPASAADVRLAPPAETLSVSPAVASLGHVPRSITDARGVAVKEPAPAPLPFTTAPAPPPVATKLALVTAPVLM